MRSPAATQASTLDEEQLVARLQAGDETAYEVLVRTYAGRLLAIARRMLASEEDARDAVQEVFISVFRNLGKFEGESRLSTWLHRVAVNTALMKLPRGAAIRKIRSTRSCRPFWRTVTTKSSSAPGKNPQMRRWRASAGRHWSADASISCRRRTVPFCCSVTSNS
jgi:DNA-directed RNA polymerase specialized sigma24 family protein